MTIIKLDKKRSRSSKIPQEKADDLSMLEIRKMKWTVIETGVWDSVNQDQEEE